MLRSQAPINTTKNAPVVNKDHFASFQMEEKVYQRQVQKLTDEIHEYKSTIQHFWLEEKKLRG